ncbi:vicilin GC72-A [Prunus yedoensis var. nudiflora]|uniref:Vicilin GC72-A n=1 Tax=Prunus yedoensis var. nudiflora TaxID=2094558 RepID=A0A315AAD5_PRUYE|nr:vicilin GC72-A [Prunus yedoensis var. nudiflora]
MVIKASYLLVFLSTLFLAASVSSTFGYKQHQHGGREREEEGRDNPFYFPSQMFQSRFKSDEGGFYVLEKFTKRRQSEALHGVENYRLAIFEAKPSTFVLPHHCDAEAIYIGSCRGYNLLVNEDNDVTLRIAKLLQPVNSPSRFETPREQLERAFGQQSRQGIVMRASKEQLRALSEQGSSASCKAIGSKSIINLPTQKPVHSDNYGKFYEARPEDFNGKFSYIEINQANQTLVPRRNQLVSII